MKYYRSPVQLRFSDFDMLRHVNNARFATFMELGRIAFFDELVNRNHNWGETGLIVARLEIDFKQPVLWGERLFVETGVHSIGTKSLQVSNRMLAGKDESDLSLRAEGKTIMVCFDYLKNTSIPIPDLWRSKLEQWKI